MGKRSSIEFCYWARRCFSYSNSSDSNGKFNSKKKNVPADTSVSDKRRDTQKTNLCPPRST